VNIQIIYELTLTISSYPYSLRDFAIHNKGPICSSCYESLNVNLRLVVLLTGVF
jgi:hypothetical protein